MRYLVNTTYHGDHTFGNAAFPDEVVIVSSRRNKSEMSDLAYEKEVRSANMYGDGALLDQVTRWRTPDVVFDSYAEIDLGGRLVQLHHFGPGNGPGDTVVYVPDTRTAWTGNFLCHAGTAHMLLQGGPEPYLASLRRMREALPELDTSVAAGRSLEETFAACSDPWVEKLDPTLSAALATYQVPQEAAQAGMLQLCRDLHRLNILATYRLYEGG
ncbi:MAG TPA: MBL fold metallo-hydrolase [Nonomuraea sp.]|nr:MBL fold metallo-hydrolase [Nonomuraea sp.]